MKRLCLVVLFAALCLPSIADTTGTANKKPNIILIVADDQGYADLGVQGATDIKTPNIDSLAASGTRFTNGYVSCAVCSPSRAGMSTGMYQTRFGHEVNPGPDAAENFGLPTDQKTLAAYLKSAGYVTGAVGKWHLGNREECRPLHRGFDSYFGFLGGAHAYVKPVREKGLNVVRRDDTPITETRYLTYAFNQEATDFIEKNKAKPFFLYLAYNAIHTPLQEAPNQADRFPNIADPRRRTMATMLAAMDDGVGRVLKTLRDNGLEDNTLIFYISDNGGPTFGNTSRNTPLSGYKGQLLEGGIRIPFIVRWKSKLPEGKVYEKPVISLDILPTALAAAGTKPAASPAIDGVNLLPFLQGQDKGTPHDKLFWRFGQQYAVRAGDWKLLKMGNAAPQLFNLASDIAETSDLVSQNKAKAQELQQAYEAFNKGNVPALWRDSRDAKGQDAEDSDDQGSGPVNRGARRAARRAVNTNVSNVAGTL